MSKSPNANIFIPALGGAALILGGAFAISTVGYGTERIEALESSFARERSIASESAARVGELQAALAEAEQSFEERIADLQAETEQRIAELSAGQAQLAAPLAEPAAPVALASTTPLGLGRDAHPDELAAWDVDVLPDGRGLPEGSGDVATGEEVFGEKCASCHGDFAEGRGAWPVLAGGFDTLDDRDPVKTVGSYWPYLSTVWDYVHRSMPFGNAGTLSDDEVYAITAYILYSNDLVDDDFTLSRETFAEVEMYNTDGFVVDDRPEAEYAAWRQEPCMENCKPAPAEITRRSTEVGVTPADDGSMVESPMEEQLARLGGTEWGKERVAGSVFMGPGGVPQDEDPATETVASAGSPATEDAIAEPDPELVASGESVFRKCSACHAVGDGARNRVGPQLNGIVGRGIGAVEGFKYSAAFQDLAAEGRVWDQESLSAFLADPKGYIKGTKMAFAGLRDKADLAAVIAYIEAAGQ
jgi:cytochrome c